MRPLVTVVIPCFNAARWLAQALDSLLAQTWDRLEILVVDDGSTDDSAAIAERQVPRVRILRQPNAGASAARNTGLREAKGDYIQFLDADDLLSPDKLAAQLRHAATQPPDTLLSCAWGRFTESPDRAAFVDEVLWRDYQPIDFLVEKFASGSMMHPAAWLVPRSVADRAGPWNSALSLDDDGEYFTRVVLAASKVSFVPGAYSYYRSALEGSLSRQRSEKAWESQLSALHLCFDHLLSREDSPRTRQVAADTLQRAVFDAYPACPELRTRTTARVTALGGSRASYEAGPRFNRLRRLLGWRLAKRLRNRFG